MFLEYWGRPDATREKFIGDWMTTGDQGVVDEDGYFHFVGRDDDVITSSGYRIGPGEIEDCLIRHPAVALAAVVGKPDRGAHRDRQGVRRAQAGHAAIATRSRAEIQAFVRTRLSAHEYPREVAFIDEMPMTTTGKIIRRLLRERAEADRRRIHAAQPIWRRRSAARRAVFERHARARRRPMRPRRDQPVGERQPFAPEMIDHRMVGGGAGIGARDRSRRRAALASDRARAARRARARASSSS